MAAKKTQRGCSICHRAGHNQRTCPQKDANAKAQANVDQALTEVAQAAAAAPVEAVPVVSAPAMSVAAATTPQEYEEWRKQVHSHGKTIVASMRRYDTGWAQFMFRFEDEKPAREEVLDLEAAKKLLAVLGWMIQQHQAQSAANKAGPLARVNGAAHATAAAPAAQAV